MDDDWWKMNVLLRLVTGEVDDFKPGLRLVLESAGFLSSEVGDGSGVNPANEKNVNTRRSTSVRRGGSITSEGFRFLLSERSFQILRLLIQYLRMQNSDSDRCTFLDHLLRVALSSVCACVELASIRDADLMILKSLGLVKSGCTASKVNISDLGATLLGGEISLAQRISSSLIGAEKDKSLQKSRKSVSELDIESFNKVHRMGHIVVETNYRIYAYTKCPLEMAIISLFARIRGRFPNLIHGALTGPSVQAAYEQGITATQLVEYINSNFHHPNASANVSSGDEKRNTNVFKSSDDNSGARNNRLPAVVEDQLHLWEHDLCRLKKRPSYLYQHFSDETMFLRVVDEANRLGAGVYVNRAKRLLIVDEGSHDAIKAFIKAG